MHRNMQMHTNIQQYVLSEKGDRQHLLRAKLKLAKHPTSTTHYLLLLTLNYPQC